jgi:hypothetical protein
MAMHSKIFLILSTMLLSVLSLTKPAEAMDRINVPVAQIIVQNNEAGRTVSNNLLNIRGESPAYRIKKYIKKRFRPTGGDQVLFIKISRATVLHQGQSSFGRDRYLIDITLDMSLGNKPYLPSKKARVNYGRRIKGSEPSVINSALPTRDSSNLVKAAIRTLDRKIIKSLHNDLDLL